MSWYIDQIGTRTAIKAVILESTQIPATIKQVIVDIIDDPNPHSTNGIVVKGSGHQGGGSANTINELKVIPVVLVV